MNESSRAVDKKLQVNNNLDILPYFQLNYEGQQILKNYKLDSVLNEEKEWNHNYVLKELSGNKDLYVEHKYKLHYISFKDYTKFLLNSAQAKASIGQDTLHILFNLVRLNLEYEIFVPQIKICEVA